MMKIFMERFYEDLSEVRNGRFAIDLSILDENSYFAHVDDIENYIGYLEICCEKEGATYYELTRAIESGVKVGNRYCMKNDIDWIGQEYMVNLFLCNSLGSLLARKRARSHK